MTTGDSNVRVERDSMGPMDVPADALYGASTMRAVLNFPISGLGVLVGLAMYLPFYVTATYGIGCVTSILLRRRLGAQWCGARLVPVAAGCIIGEALPALVMSIIKAGS